MKKLLKNVICTLFALILFAGINTSNANAADAINPNGNIGKRLTIPEGGWRRYDDVNNNIYYTSGIYTSDDGSYYGGRMHYWTQAAADQTTKYIKFSFYGDEIRLIGHVYTDSTTTSEISFDNGQTFEKCSPYGVNSASQTVFYEKTDLEKTVHDVVIRIPYQAAGKCFRFDAVDINDDGYLVPVNNINTDNCTYANNDNPNIGKQVTAPEEGWRRYDDKDSNILLSGGMRTSTTGGGYYNSTFMDNLPSAGNIYTQYVRFSFYGTKLRLINYVYTDRAKNLKISFDGGKNFEIFSQYGVNSAVQAIYYEKTGLEKTVHDVIIEIPQEETAASRWFDIDSMDIDKDGYLLPAYNNVIAKNTLNLDRTLVNLAVNSNVQLSTKLTAEGYTAQDIVWVSSDNSVAVVDGDGKITAKNNGVTVVKAYIPNTEYIAACLVTVGDGKTTVSGDNDNTGDKGGNTSGDNNNNGGNNSGNTNITPGDTNTNPGSTDNNPSTPGNTNTNSGNTNVTVPTNPFTPGNTAYRPHEYMGDMKDIILTLINTDKFKIGETNEETAAELAKFVKTYDKGIYSAE